MLKADTELENSLPALKSEPTAFLGPIDLSAWRRTLSQIDRELQQAGLLNRSPLDWVSFERNIAGRMYASRFHYRFPRTENLITTPEDLAGLLFRMGRDPLIRERVLADRVTDLSASKISDLIGVCPYDLKDSHLQTLLAQGHFGTWQDAPLPNYNTKSVPEHFEVKPLPEKIRKKDPPYDPKLAPVAYLITRDLTSEDLIETYLPELRYEEFHRLQAKIHREVEKTLPERFKRFQTYWKALTIAQKQALRAVHMTPDRGGRTYVEATKLLGITKDALKERLKSAVSALREHYPKLQALRDQPEIKGLWRPTDFDGMRIFNFARAKIPGPVTRLDCKTRSPLETFTQPKAKTRTPIQNLAAKILEWERTHYDPQHDGVGSPRLAHMTAISSERTQAALSTKNQKKAAARLRQIEDTGEPISAAETAKRFRLGSKPTGERSGH